MARNNVAAVILDAANMLVPARNADASSAVNRLQCLLNDAIDAGCGRNAIGKEDVTLAAALVLWSMGFRVRQ